MLRNEKQELVRLLEEKALGNFQRRKRRMLAAEGRLRARGNTLSDMFTLAKQGDPDALIVVNLGFLPDETEGAP